MRTPKVLVTIKIPTCSELKEVLALIDKLKNNHFDLSLDFEVVVGF